MAVANPFPASTQPFVGGGGVITAPWYQFLRFLYTNGGSGGSGGGNIAPIPVTGSPFAYRATTSGFLWVSPGSISNLHYARGTGSVDYGLITRGIFPMLAGDTVTLTYFGSPPVLSFVPA